MVEVFVDAPCEDIGAVSGTVIRAAEAALLHEAAAGSLAVRVVDDAEIHRLNLEFRSVDRPTDVLSFPASEGEAFPGTPWDYLGDIAISLPRAHAQAGEYGHSLERELSFLTVHGVLHLLGYDHNGEWERETMDGVQREILDKMGIGR